MTDSAHIAVEQRRWRFGLLFLASVFSLIWHSFPLIVKFRSMDAVLNEAQGRAGLVLVGLVWARMLIARLRDERGSGWRFYALFCVLSPVWIPTVFNLVSKFFAAA